jgi:hypothetical protein
MSHLSRLGNEIFVPIRPDGEGFIGRECPVPECCGYFKIQPGTGLKGKDLLCHCPYCGHKGSQNTFWTKEQLEYAKSVVLSQVTDAFIKDLKSLEFNHRPKGPFGIGFSLQIKGSPQPIRYYREKQLETEVICDSCSLRYAIYGVFAFCPDCGIHNSVQILHKNLDLSEKEVALAARMERELADHLVADALENAVSAFDGFGRETCKVHAGKSSDPAMAENISFQNLARAEKYVHDLFGVDLSVGVDLQEWDLAWRCFQKRHLFAHKMGVVDEEYLRITKDPRAVVGRKVATGPDEVSALIRILRALGSHIFQQLSMRNPSVTGGDSK